MSQPKLIITDIGSGYLVIDERGTKVVGKTSYTELKYGVCKGRIDVSFEGFRAVERDDGSVVLSDNAKSVPVTVMIQTMAEGFLKRDTKLLRQVWETNMEKVRELFGA
jgi:hypothetical protein